MKEKIRKMLMAENPRSAWNGGVREYALELLDNIEDEEEAFCGNYRLFRKAVLNGAQNWTEYSYAGCGLIYDSAIAERLCNKTELRKTRNGSRNPNARESWLDVQARALHQACEKVYGIFAEIRFRESL